MALDLKPETLRLLVWAGIADVAIGIGIAISILSGFFGPGNEIAAVGGAVVALWGVVLIVWGRKKLSEAENRRGDLN
jgi:membrane associated rhomboid family serine protease